MSLDQLQEHLNMAAQRSRVQARRGHVQAKPRAGR